MPCYTGITSSDEARHWEVLLCKACKFLTVKQIQSLTNPGSGICDGLDWYSNHLWLDCSHNADIFGGSSEKEKQIALKKLTRIGYEVKDCDGGTQLMQCKIKQVYPY